MTVRAMKAGASDFLTKSFRDEDLLTAVTHPLHRSRTLAPDTHPPAAVTRMLQTTAARTTVSRRL